MSGSAFRKAVTPWAGLVAAVLGAGIAHQFGAEGTFDDCGTISPVPLIVVAAACIGAALAGGLVSSKVARRSNETPTRRLVAVVSVGMAGLAAFATLLPVIASLTLPPCFQ